ncbi:glycosyltransferase family 39 protein [Candidatus Roizmanbacteria bacterium]|nr:MAG: glycosyltransferase family 39 protein [Candidatus Roizmanbacteria bacterium]
MKIQKKHITIILVAAALVTFIWHIIPVISEFERYTEKYDAKQYEDSYNKSQYVIPQSKHYISDEMLLSHAGYAYVHGLNPILINSDHPPLGKYIIGWITVLSGNNRVSSLVFGFLVYLIVSVIIYRLTASRNGVLLGIFFLSTDTVFRDQLYYAPILDIIQVSFLLAYILFFLLYLQTSKKLYLLLMGLSAGAMAGIKLFFPVIVLLTVSAIYLGILNLFGKRKKLTADAISISGVSVLAGLTYMMSYLMLFIQGGTVRTFLGVQKWIFLFWKNNSIDTASVWGNIVPFVLFNKWKVWWGTEPYISYEHWSIFWPVYFLAGMGIAVTMLVVTAKKIVFEKKHAISSKLPDSFGIFLSMWVVIALMYLLFIPISPRYLMILYFPIYILIVFTLHKRFPNYV